MTGAPRHGGAPVPFSESRADGHDFAGLNRLMTQVKDRLPEQTRVYLAAEPGIDLGLLIATMDATTETTDGRLLFSDVVMSVVD